MHQFIISYLGDLLKAQGVEHDEWLYKAGIAGETLGDAEFLNAAVADRLCGTAIALCNDPDLGLKLGQNLTVASLGMFGYALMTSPTVGSTLKLLLRYNRALLPSVDISLQHNERFSQLLIKGEHLPKSLQRYYADAMNASIVTNLKILAPHALEDLEIELSYSSSSDTALLDAIFGDCQIRFNSDRCALNIPAQSLLVAMQTSDSLAQDIFRRHCDRLLARDSHAGFVSERVKRELLDSRSFFPTSAMMAQRLHISESTLQRRLAKEGTKFQRLLDEVRYRLALEYLHNTHLGTDEIAHLLGFNNATNFRRAFKRWSSITPSEARLKSVGVTQPEE
ncbi:MAG: AraC family transcriptional regulator ligand-binding domain-containing protein [Porticoccaceae bacterium]